jgi:ligand-binding sensor domain-containing protein
VDGSSLNTLTEPAVDHALAVDAYDNIWSVVRDPSFRGVMSLQNRGRIDSVVRVQVTSADGLPSDDIRTIVADRDNDLWVGTDKGIGIILDPLNPKRKDGIASYKPLPGQVVNTIAVDPLNQKWVGTTEGVILLSPDGTLVLAQYTVQNTGGKLINNDIKSIAVDPRSGTVYFGTAQGLASLTTAAVAPRESFDGLTMYPNPFRTPSTTPLTIDGLVAGSRVKILSIDGSLVRDLATPGGRIGFWDGKDEGGRDVPSGVYYVVGYSPEESKNVATGKVAVIRK